MNKQYSAAPSGLLPSLWRHRDLIGQLSRQEIIGRYRGSLLGMGWSFVTPLLMLLIYTFVFSVVFGARWAGLEQQGRAAFAIVLFLGMSVFSIFSEVVVRSPRLVVANSNYVKRVVFPLEILPVVQMANALFHFMVGVVAWTLAAWFVLGRLQPTMLLLPLVIAPLVLGTLGVSWLLSSIGVFIRDLDQTITLLVTATLFLTPIFYPVESIPPVYRKIVMANPLAQVVEQARMVMIDGHVPGPAQMLVSWLAGIALLLVGYAWFQKTREGFADVL